jgi:uncharacterized hydrophobic protein (TIGR00271 family)
VGILRSIVDDNRFKREDLPPLVAKLFFEGAKQRVHRESFAVLLFLSTVIATYGVIGDSTATVIGAMIIAPLMTPIMATGAGLVMGDMARAGRSFLTVLAGVLGVTFTAWLIGAFISTSVISVTSNFQIVSRVSPSLTDLMVALASGAAGAFAMSRSDVADTLPGVAISVALVPPLAVVGIALSQGELVAAWGAMLLFLTNFLSILLAGGGVFALLGLSAASTKELTGTARRTAFIYIAIGVAVVTIPLAATTIKVTNESIAEYQARRFAQQWLAESGFELNQVKADGNQITIIINGSGEPPPLPSLGKKLDPHQVELKIVPSQILFYPEPALD